MHRDRRHPMRNSAKQLSTWATRKPHTHLARGIRKITTCRISYTISEDATKAIVAPCRTKYAALQARSSRALKSIEVGRYISQQEIVSQPGPKRMRPNTPPRSFSPRLDGSIRKKNARFDIPAERNLFNIDNIIQSCTNEDDLKELKIKKELLHDRQASTFSFDDNALLDSNIAETPVLSSPITSTQGTFSPDGPIWEDFSTSQFVDRTATSSVVNTNGNNSFFTEQSNNPFARLPLNQAATDNSSSRTPTYNTYHAKYTTQPTRLDPWNGQGPARSSMTPRTGGVIFDAQTDPLNYADYLHDLESWRMNYTDPNYLISPSEQIGPLPENFFNMTQNLVHRPQIQIPQASHVKPSAVFSPSAPEQPMSPHMYLDSQTKPKLGKFESSLPHWEKTIAKASNVRRICRDCKKAFKRQCRCDLTKPEKTRSQRVGDVYSPREVNAMLRELHQPLSKYDRMRMLPTDLDHQVAVQLLNVPDQQFHSILQNYMLHVRRKPGMAPA